ncbi:MAG: NAD-dependent epimerase/dehydratase family protein [Solirubrobacterales bacterium]|nr:NAD-dependent epimerase/dehydratase family protein [Solirubrobacterales bacterium]
MKIFMTGATGFIGTSTARQLTEQGHNLTCLVRDRSKATGLSDLGCELVDGDLSDQDRLAVQMQGSDAVVHNAALYEVGIPESRRQALKEANIDGTSNVLNACLDASIPRVLYVSTCAVFGNTSHEMVDESFERPNLNFTSYYEETKYEAHQIAKDLIENRNLPCVIAQPAGVYGPDDHSALAGTIHQFLDGKLPLMPFPDFGTGLAYVDDVAAGLILILDKGRIGESYILTSDNVTMREIIETSARVAGKKAPSRAMPTGLLKLLRPVGPLVGKLMGQPPNLRELIASTDGVTFWANPEKAKKELGFRPRDLETGLRDTFKAEGRL